MTLVMTTTDAIRSEFRQFSNADGKTIAAYVDFPISARPPYDFVVMAPKYGESKKNNLQLAYHLAANGLSVLRFDFTCHFGESEGDMLDFTLPDSVENIGAAFDYLEEEFGVSEAILIANSLSSVPAFRAAASDRRISHLVAVVPVVDFGYSISKVYQEDLIGGYIEGRRYGVQDILGHDVNMDNFCRATVGANMHGLDGTIGSLRDVQCDVTLFPAAGDVWVAMEDIEKVAACNPRIRVQPIEGAMHEVRENKTAAETLVREVVGTCFKQAFGIEFDPAKMAAPEKKVLFAQNRTERDRLRVARPVTETEDEFWGKYLAKYRVMEKMGDYQEYLDGVGAGLGEFRDGEILLDAGCGNGLFGIWVLRELMQRTTRRFETPPLYLGLDLTDSGLQDAVDKHLDAERLLRDGARREGPAPGLLYGLADLDYLGLEDEAPEDILRFEENCFDKIACSLLLSYLKSPQRLLDHLYKLLRPGGKIVVSSMKPFCDLSAIYRDFVEEKAAKQDVESARELLRAAGAIQVKQDQGYYIFFSDEELTAMLASAGFVNPRCFTSLGNQANVAIAAK